MSAVKSVREMGLGQMHEFAISLDKAGFTADLVQKITNAKGNKLANALYAALAESSASSSVLKLLSSITLPATREQFVARDKFVRDTSRKAKVKIGWISDDFFKWFLEGDGKIEDAREETTLRFSTLTEDSVSLPIIAELGGEAKAEVTLSEVFALLKMQGNGKEGALLNNGGANIFYARDLTGVLRAVGVRWIIVHSWYVYADLVKCPIGWCAGHRVFARA